MNGTELTELRQAIHNHNVLLFVGAGISKSIGLPTWGQLISNLAGIIGIDQTLYTKLGDPLALAEYYSLTFHDPNKEPMQVLCKMIQSAEEKVKDQIQDSAVYNAIVKLNCPIIYTTNYDHCLEAAYENQQKAYQRITDVADIGYVSADKTQIVKFHGDYLAPETIVFTESSYFERLNFESPLDIKLCADMLSKTILFIGYSLSDVNVRLLLYKLDKMWRQNEKASAETPRELNRPKSFIFMAVPNYIQERILRERGIIPIIGECADAGESTLRFLTSLL